MNATRKPERPDEYLAGVPNRDLTEEDYARLTPDQQAEIAESGLWDVEGAPPESDEPPAEPESVETS